MIVTTLPLFFLIIEDGIYEVVSAPSKGQDRCWVDQLFDAAGADGGIARILARRADAKDEVCLTPFGVFLCLPEGCNLAVRHLLDGRDLEDASLRVEPHSTTMIALFSVDQTVIAMLVFVDWIGSHVACAHDYSVGVVGQSGFSE